MVLMNKAVVAKTALDSDYRTTYTQVNEHSCYSISDSTRIQEIADYDTPLEHMLPENHGTGLIWRLHSVTRFEERDGGVYIQLEAVALSRDIPGCSAGSSIRLCGASRGFHWPLRFGRPNPLCGYSPHPP